MDWNEYREDGESRDPTPMGFRILAFMKANAIRDKADFAEGLLGITRDDFDSWIYGPTTPETVPAKPVLLCAEAFTTNAQYLLCMSDDPRMENALTYDEGVLLQAFRDIGDPDERDDLVQAALERVPHGRALPSAASPFPGIPIPRLRGRS